MRERAIVPLRGRAMPPILQSRSGPGRRSRAARSASFCSWPPTASRRPRTGSRPQAPRVNLHAVPRRCRRPVRLVPRAAGRRILEFLRRQSTPVPLEAVLGRHQPRRPPPPGFGDVSARPGVVEMLAARGARSGIDALCWSDPAYPPLLATIPDAPFVLWVNGGTLLLRGAGGRHRRVAGRVPLRARGRRPPGRRPGRRGRRGRQRAGARRGLGGSPGRAGGRWRHRRRARFGRRRHLPAGARAPGGRRSRVAAPSSASTRRAPCRVPSIFPRATASSAASRGRSSWSRRPSGAARSSPPRWRSNRDAKSWRCPGASSPAATAAATP